MRIWRYELEVTDRQTLELPLGYKLLSVAPSRRMTSIGPTCRYLDLWVQVPEQGVEVPVEIQIVGTGNPTPQARLEFLGTCVMPNGLVWHVFERPDPMKKVEP